MNITVSKAILRDKEVIGVFGSDLALVQLNERIEIITENSPSLILVGSLDNVLIYEPDITENLLKNMPEINEDYAWLTTLVNGQVVRGNYQGEDVFAYTGILPQFGWRLYVIEPASSVFLSANAAIKFVLLAAFVLLVAMVFFGLWCARRMVAPIKEVSDGLREVAQGEASLDTDSITLDRMNSAT